MSARNRELVNLFLAGVVAFAAFAATSIALSDVLLPPELAWAGGVLAGMYLVAHIVVRRTAPAADPSLLPIAGLLTAVGLDDHLPPRPG